MIWKKIDRTVNSEGSTIPYAAEGTDRQLLVQSRKRKIHHAASMLGYGGATFWWHTTYFVLLRGEEIKECWSLADAKEHAEQIWQEADDGRR